MSDHDLDRRVAEIVGVAIDAEYFTREGDYFRPQYNMETAIASLEAMREKGWSWEVRGYCKDEGFNGEPPDFYCMLWRPDTEDSLSDGEAETLPLAVCRAIVATQEKP